MTLIDLLGPYGEIIASLAIGLVIVSPLLLPHASPYDEGRDQ